MKTTRTLTAGLALALGLALAPTAAGAAGSKAPNPTPTLPPPVGADDIATVRPDLSIELDDSTEYAFTDGRIRLSSPLDQDLHVVVGILFPEVQPSEVWCETAPGGGCDHTRWLVIEAGDTVAEFEIESIDPSSGDEDAELIGAEITSVTPQTAVAVADPSAEALIYDGDGLDLELVGEAEASEGDPGSPGTLGFVVEADQAVPHPVGFRFHTGIVGGDNGATPGVDHAPVDVVAELPAGETTVTVDVPLVGDQLAEPDELFFGYIDEPTHGKIWVGHSTAVGRILDDDQPVVTWKAPGGYQSPSRSARSAALTA
jgi:hypothetical protein